MKVFSLREAVVRFSLVVLGLSYFLLPARATTIEYVVSDLADVTPGEDLWRYDYTVSGRSFLQSEFFDIYFDPILYGTLTAGPAPDADWDVAVLQQPNPANLPPFDTGIFDAFALTDNPPLLGSFSATFVYLGTGNPGAQPFAIFNASSSLVETGLTRVPGTVVPEPSTAALSFLGLAALVIAFLRTPYSLSRRPLPHGRGSVTVQR